MGQDDIFLDEMYLSANEVWVYNVDTQHWKKVKTEGDGPIGTSGATAILVGVNMYIVGGHCFSGNTCETYRLHLPSSTWHHIDISSSACKFSPRDKFTGWKYQNRLYIFGGFGYPLSGYLDDHGCHFGDDSTDNMRGWNNQLLYLDLNSPDTWHNPKCSGAIPSARAAHAAVCIDDFVYLFGGRHENTRLNDLHILHLPSLVWKRVDVEGLQPEGRSWHSLTAISHRHLFLYGGYSQHQQPLGDGWLLDTHSLQWTPLNLPENQPRLWHTACQCDDGEVLIFGGCCSDILSVNGPTQHSGEVLSFHCSPKSLVRLTLDAVFQYRDLLGSEWDCLPTSLSSVLRARLPTLSESQESEEQKTRSCVVS